MEEVMADLASAVYFMRKLLANNGSAEVEPYYSDAVDEYYYIDITEYYRGVAVYKRYEEGLLGEPEIMCSYGYGDGRYYLDIHYFERDAKGEELDWEGIPVSTLLPDP